MRLAYALAAVLLVAAVAASPQGGLAQAGSRITIDLCTPVFNQSGVNTPAPIIPGLQLSQTSNGMHITFVNTSRKTAKVVNFAVDSNGNRFIIRDVGTFSPNVQIDHQYRNGSGQGFILPTFIAPKVTCSVESVTYEDGSVWPSAGPPAAAAPVAQPSDAGGLVVTPDHLDVAQGAQPALFLVQSSEKSAGFKETDNCGGIATVFVASTTDTSATYLVRPVGPGSCTATVMNGSGGVTHVSISIR